MRSRPSGEDGSVLLLVVFYAVVAATMIVVAVDVSKLFLARRALTGVADAAALTAAQTVDRDAVYGQRGSGCELPIDGARAERAVDDYVASVSGGLHGTVTTLEPPATSIRSGTVTVRLEADVHVPFDTIVTVLLPGRSPTVHLTVTSHARSPLVGACP
jgi:uncharacterized membrane protein